MTHLSNDKANVYCTYTSNDPENIKESLHKLYFITREQFISKLPKTINHFSYGICSLTILEDNKYRKIACYMNKDKWIAGYRIGRDFEKLFKEVMEYLRKEGYG